MHKISYRPYIFLILFFLFLMSLPQEKSEKIRSFFVCAISPTWRAFSFLKEKSRILLSFPFVSSFSKATIELEKLSQENQLLRSQIETIREWILNEKQIQEQVERMKYFTQAGSQDPSWKEFFKRRSQELCHALELQVQSLPAQVIFREPISWSSMLWINRGEQDNQKVGKKIIDKNSPVLLGTSIIGVVEYVGFNRSRVRLITDARLTPSVRAVRGKEQNRFLLEHLNTLLSSLEGRKDFFSSAEETTACIQQLHHLKNILLRRMETLYLAKGELHGTSSPLWRSRHHVLKGFGFNYDFADAEGPARDLRSGEPYDIVRKKEAVPLLKPGDLLITTGFDGVFPPGFRVAIVSFVSPLKEGASSYDIEAVSTAGNLDEITHVFVLPPVSPSKD